MYTWDNKKIVVIIKALKFPIKLLEKLKIITKNKINIVNLKIQ